MDKLLAELAGMAVGVWAVAELIKRATRDRVDIPVIAVILGIISGVIALWGGWIDVQIAENSPDWVRYPIAMFLGLTAAAVAGVAHDKVIKPVRDGVRGLKIGKDES